MLRADDPISVAMFDDQAIGGEYAIAIDGGSGVNRTDFPHDHTVNLPSIESGIQSDNHYHSLSHAHSVGGQTVSSGGDSETAPDHIYMYWISYTGSSAPNWSGQ